MPKKFQPQLFSYSVCAKIGEGLHSEVYKVVKSDPGHNLSQVMALKILKSKSLADIWKNEFENLSKISSNYCVRVLGWEWISARPTLVLEYIEGVSLQELLDLQSLSILEINCICTQLYWGLKDLQKFGVAHGDLNPHNILFTLQAELKLIDFGVQGSDLDVLYTSPKFCAPELFYEKKPTYESDLYSLAILRKLLLSNRDYDLEGKDLEFFNVLIDPDPKKRSNFFLDTISLLEAWPCGEEQEKSLAKKIDFLVLKKKKHQEKTKKIENFDIFLNASKNKILTQGFFEKGSAFMVSLKYFFKSIVELKQKKSKIVFISVSLFLFFVSSSSLGFSQKSLKVSYTQLAIFTGDWKKIFIDEVFVGYTPIPSLYLKRGSHRLVWVSKDSRGVFNFTTSKVNSLLLRDDFFQR